MLENGIIEQSFSPFSSPVTLVTKRDKTKRFCIDYRKVNELISSDVHPLPRIEDILDRLAQAKYFSTADISSAYWQVPIHPDSRPLLAFATFEGLYQPTRLPFGLKTSPQIYERAISQVLQRHGLDCVAHYFDDFIIYSNTLEEHQNHLRQFFAFCEAEKLQLNFAKCEFFKQSINFLGYTITAGTITPLTRNTDIIHAIKQPHNRKTLQSFLGAVNVYNKFIPEYARLRAPLNNLLKKDVVWNWNEACQEAFIDLKGNLTQHPILHLYKEGLPCQVYCDASTLGIAGILKQVHPDGNVYPVQYFSRTLRPHEKNYSISELECLAIVESVEKFRIYLMGRKFTIFSDHHALQWLKTIKNPSGRLFRWSLRLSSYEYEVRYIKGKLQYETDLLSRNPFCGFLDATLIKTHQSPPSKESSLTIDHNGLHTVSRKGVTKIILPKPLIQQLLQTVHTQYNHPGISQMSRIISTQYYWQGMSKDIKQKVKTCPTCQLTKRPVGPTYGELSQPPESKEPFDLLSLDTIAGFAKYGNTKIYLHVVVDHFSRYAWAFPSKSTSTTTYQQVLKRVFQDGSPKRLLTDRAPAFTSPKFRSFLLNRNIHPLLTTSNNPQANGLCERLNATLTGKLRLLHLENPKVAWTKLVKKVTLIYNKTPHSTTGFPPIYLMFGILPPEISNHNTPYPDIDKARKIAHTRTQNKHLQDKNTYDQRHKQPHFEVGDLVLVKLYHHPNTGKLAPYFTGPHTILEIISPNVVRIDRPNQPLQRDTDTIHVNKLKLYTEKIHYISPPAVSTYHIKHNPNYTFPFKHLTPELFPTESLRFKPTSSEPFRHLDPAIFATRRFTSLFPDVKNCKPDNQLNHITPPPKDIKQENYEPTNHSNSTYLHAPFSLKPIALFTCPQIIKPQQLQLMNLKVNELISSDVHPLPRIEDILDRLAQAKYFSTADISSAYWQVPIHPDSRPLLAFATFEGLYQPTRLPFGLKTSPQIYERAISQVLQRHGLDCVAHYFDDFIIYSNTLEEHQNHLRQFFAFCEAEKLQLNFAKCEFFKQSINFLGYTITAGTITPLTRNTDIIHAIKQPHNRKTLQSFLGAVNVYNKFIPEYARLRAPLNNLLKKDVVWNWNEACQEAFIDLKGNLTQHPILHLYKEGLPCQVYCDASTLGIAGILKQVHPDGNVYPVQYFSRTLRPHEKNYSISELECLAIVESVEKFRIYLMGRKFTIFSDHHALQWLKTIKNPSGRLFRWSLRLSSYEYEVRYIKGKLQYETDLLSRNPFCGFLDATLIKTHQSPPSKESSLTIDHNGLHTVSRKGVTKIILPKPLIQQLLQTVHTQYNHPGISQMSRIISTQYYWQGMSKDIKQKVKTCPTCQLTKRPVGPTYGELSQPPESKEPFDLLSLDTIAGFAKYGNTKIYLHVVVDHFSRYAWAFPSKSTSTTTYQQVLKRVFQDGSPKRLLTDRAPAFTSPKFRSFLLNRNIHPLLTTSNNPQANGLCERLNATLTGKLRLLHLENPKVAWTKLVKKVTLIYNKTPHSTTGFPPIYLMFGILPPEISNHNTPYPDIDKARKIAHTRTQNKHLQDKNTYDQRHKQPHFEVGDLVLVKLYHHPNTGKLAPYFTGPHTILEIISPNVVRIDRPNQPLQRDTDTIHVNKLKLYTEKIHYISPPAVSTYHIKHNPNYTFPFKHLTPELFPTESLRFKPTSSEPFRHLDPAIFATRRFTSLFPDVKNCKPDNQLNHITPPPKDIKQENYEPTNHSNSTYLHAPFSLKPIALFTCPQIIKPQQLQLMNLKVNELISSDVHPLPRIEDILDRLAQAKYFSTADISSAYWQVPIHPDSRPLLAFATFEGLYQPTRLPFGLKTSPQIYERAISQVLQRHGLDCVAHYFDDFIIYSNTLEEHQNHLRQFFAFCEAEKLQLNFAKCEFFKQSINFLGYTITAGTITPLTRNTDIIHAIKQPHNRKTLQSFLGAVNVYNKFIPEYARLRAPLNNLLKKDVVWNWNEACQEAFIDLKGNLTQHPILHLYKEGLPCQVYCDASTLGIAGILKQVHPDGNVYPVQYFSRTLRPHEKNYSISELECLAIVESVEKFRIYLMGRKFTIFSDHHALQWLKTIKNPSGRLFRWSLRLSSYEYEVRYIKGKLQYETDLLSRNPFCGFLDATLIKTHQSPPSKESSLTIDHNGLHTVSRKGVTKIILPKPLIQQLLQTVHTQYNHPGISQMSRIISTQYYWQGMSKDIKQKVKTCPTCQLTKRPVGPTYGELSQPPESKEPFDLLSLDTIAGFAKYGNTKIYLHVVVDHFSRYAWAFPSKSTSTTTYQQVLKRVFQDGSPKRLLTDRAPAFTSPKFRSFLLNRNIHPLLTTSNNPQANGLCERLNATLTGKLRLLHLENPKVAWTKLVKKVTLIYNKTPHSTTGFPPIYLMFGILPPEISNHNTPYPDIDKARKIAHTRTQNKHLQDKNTYDQRHKQPHFEVGDLVLVKLYHHPNTGKLAPYFTGPHTILEIISPNVVRIDRPNQPLQRDTDTIHVNKLKLYTEKIHYISPPAVSTYHIKHNPNYTFPFKHLTPELFPTESLRFKPTSSEPFRHLDPAIFATRRFTSLFPDVKNCKPDNQLNHITPPPKDIKQENYEPTNHSNSTYLHAPFSLKPIALFTCPQIIKPQQLQLMNLKVNELISSDVHPLPRIEDILDRLAQAKYFSTADISSAYWQVPIHPDSRPLLAFATFEGLYQPTRLPFGLKTSPQIYERAISQVLQRHGLDCVAHYFDDFIIYSNTLEEHQNHLRQFFAFCEAEKLQLNFAKCEFFKQSINFLGYTITAGTITPLTRNTDIIHAIKQPHNRKTLQSFLGAVNVYNKFIPEYARLRAPLNNLLKKDVVWNWNEACQEAFIDLKGNLTQHPILHLYKEGLPCQVYCDASTLGIAGILKQVHPDGNVYPVQYFSRTLRPHEKNYSISELECLAIVESVEKFRIYLMGRKFTIFSDHHALQWLKTIKNPSGRLFRWSLRLSSYEYEVRYIKGKLQYETDLLSRNPFCGFLDATLIKTHQSPPSKESSLTIDHNGLHTVSRKGVTKIILPKPLIQQLLQTVHTQYNHPGISQMSRIISTQYYWQGMSKDIKQKVKTCPTCQLTKRPVGPTYGELSQPPESKEPFDLLSLDTIAGFAKYGNTKIYLHVVVDHFSRYAWAFPSKSTSTTTYQQVLKRVFQDGSPKRLLTDRAPAFTSPKFRSFLLNRNIHPLLTTSNNPQANGLCERLNATLTGKLRLLHLENPKVAWTKLVKKVTLIYNKTPHSTTGFPPIYLMFGILPPEISNHNTPYPDIDKARKIAHTRTQNKHLQDKNTYDQRHKQPHFEVGDLVLVKLYHHPNTGKLAPYFTGPHTILEIISPNVVRIDRPNQPLQRDTDTIHVNKLKLYTEKIHYISPPAVSTYHIKHNPNYTFPFKHLTPELFPTESLRFKPTSSEPFRHLDPAIFATRRFTSLFPDVKNCKPDNQLNHITPPPKDIKQENYEPTNHSNSTYLHAPFSLKPIALFTCPQIIKPQQLQLMNLKVNELISSDVHPLPRIEDILDRLAQAKYFSTADISSAYWQVPIHPDSRPLLAFATFEGLYQPTRLPFGLKTSPQIYERAISQVLQRHGLDCVAHYFDDFIIYSNTLEEHQNHLRQFFAFCEAEKLQLNFAKCEFFKQSINFLGYTITAGTITPLTRNTDIIHAIKQPHNRKTLQSFLGAVNVYNKFIPEYARLRAPLNNLLKKDVVWNWNEACQEAFIDLKGNLTQHPILHLYKEGLPCQVYCDASTLGIAGILKQVHPDGNVYPVQYFSRTLRPHEKNYSISELECLAIVESVEKFRIYLMGRKFTIFSDHHALQWLKTIKNPSGRLFRWSLRLSSYEYEVRYIKGKLQYETDLLSRNPFCGFLDATLIKTHQSPPSKESSLTIDHNGLHTVSRKGVTKIILPKPLIQQLLQTVHTQYNHPGISQMSRIISTQYYWQGMSKDIKQKVKTCPTCQLTKRPVGPTYGELSQPPESKEPFDLLSLDTIAGFAKYGNTKIYLHVVVDHFSRYAWAFPSKSTSTTTYQQVLKRVFQDGSPKRLLTDRAPAFTSPKFRSFLLNRNIHPLLTTSNNPQANGLCERLNATLTGKLRLLHLENPKVAWTKLVKKVTLIYNKTPHSTTGFPPIYLMFGILPPEISNHNTPYPDIDKARKIAHTRTQNKHLQDKNTYDQRHKQPHFEVGDLVLVKLYHHPNTGKLAPYFTGPHTILEIISPNVVRIDRPNQPLQRDTDTIHVNKLKLYTEKIHYISPPAVSTYHIKHNPNYTFPFKHLTPELFPTESLRFKPTSSEPFRHLDPAIFATRRFTSLFPDVKNCKPDNQLNHITPPPKDIKQENYEPTNHSNSTYLHAPFSLKPIALFTCPQIIKPQQLQLMNLKVNELISSDVHPLPRIEDILDRLAQAKYFSTADISSAYWQVPIHPDSRPLLAFATFEGLYQPTRLPFGLKTSPQIYERAISQVLQRHGLDCVAHYFDDFIIYSNTLEEHQNHLRQFFAFCEAEKLQLNFAKCEFFKQSINFLGYTITAGTITPLTRNTDIIHAIKQPHNRKTLQSFLGAVNVYNKFIPEYARLRAPLNNLLKKDVVWNWNEACQEAFIDLKGNLTQHPILHLYKEGLPCQVYCDASTLGIAGILKQVHPDGNVYPVQYFSRTLRPHEKNYSISELECLAIVESVEKFRIYLMGRKFTIFSDHHALQWLKTIKNPSGRLFRWSLRLSSYEYEVRYIKGKLQYETDLLSRNPFCGFLDATLIKTHQSPPSKESSLTIDHNGLHTVSRKGVTKIILPKPLIQQLLQTVHTQYNHPGISQMSRIISTQYYWQGMSKDIKQKVKTCPTCQLTKRPVGPTYGELSQPPESKEPFDLLSLDTIAGFAKYGNTKIYLHVVVDHFSRYAWAFPSKSTSTTTYQQVLKRVFQDGSPKRLLTDRAPAFTSPKFRSFLLNRNIHPLLTTSNNPQANGLCERLNATLTGKLRLLHLENPKVAWTKLVKKVTLIYNKTPHSTTGFPPIYLMFGILPPEISNHNTPYPDIDKARKIAHTRTQNKHLQDKNTYDQRHKQPHFEVGDLVLVKLYHHPNTGKLAPYFTGPHTILEIISPNVVRIDRPNQPLQRDTDTIHVNKLKLYTEKIHYISPPAVSTYHIKHNPNYTFPFKHLTPELFPTESLRFKPTSSEPFRHLDPAIFATRRFTSLFPDVKNCKPDNQLNHITPPPKDIKQENYEPTNHSNSTINK
ncbi:hypothetical protein LAZ67_8000812, partial [Cordylochernes scorpioides]